MSAQRIKPVNSPPKLEAVRGSAQRNPALYSSLQDHWRTPVSLFQALDSEFNFDLDPCPINGTNGLVIPWAGRRIFCNPPYGPEVRQWLGRAHEADLAVYLLPARTDTIWFHEVVLPGAAEIRFLKGRLRFGDGKGRATFPSMVCVFRRKP